MKLRDLLKYLDWAVKVKLFSADCPTEDADKPEFTGAVMDIPWIYIDWTIDDETTYGGSIDIGKEDDSVYLYIYLKEA